MGRGRIDIVVVEDDVAEQELVRRALAAHGFSGTVHVAHDGEEVIDLLHGSVIADDVLRLGQPRCLLLDLRLPKMDGLEVIRRLRADPRTRFLPIVVMTCSREPRDVIECYTAGANGYVVKPVAFDEFVETMGDVVRYWLRANQPPS